MGLDPLIGRALSETLALKKRDAPIAMREFRAALQTGAADKAAAHCDLGESYLLAGNKAEAKKQAEELARVKAEEDAKRARKEARREALKDAFVELVKRAAER